MFEAPEEAETQPMGDSDQTQSFDQDGFAVPALPPVAAATAPKPASLKVRNRI